MWNDLAHRELREFPQQGATGGDLSADGATLLVRTPGNINIVDAKTFDLIRRFPAETSRTSVVLHLNQDRFLEASLDFNVYVRDIKSGALLGTIADAFVSGRGMMSSDGRWALATDAAGLPKVLDLRAFTSSTANLPGKVSAFSHSGRTIAAAIPFYAQGGFGINVVGYPSFNVSRHLGGESLITCLAFGGDDRRLVAGTDKGRIEYWNLDSSKLLWSIPAHIQDVRQVELSKDGETLLTTGGERTSKVYALSDAGLKLINTFPGGSSEMLSPDGAIAYLSYWSMRSYNTVDAHGGLTLQLPKGPCLATRIDPTGMVWTLQKSSIEAVNAIARENRVHSYEVPAGARFSGLATRHPWVFTQEGDKMSVVDLLTGHLLKSLTCDLWPGWAAESQDGKKLALFQQKEIQVWNLDTGTRLRSFTFPALVYSADILTNGTMAFGCEDGSAKIIKQDGSQLDLNEHMGRVAYVRFSPDGKKLITCSNDETAVVYDAQSGKMLNRLVGHAAGVTCGDVSPDGTRYATSSADRTVRIWDAQTGRELTVLEGYSAIVKSVRFSSDGKTLITIDQTGLIRIWPTDNSWKQK